MKQITKTILTLTALLFTGTVLALWLYKESYVTTIQVHSPTQISNNYSAGPMVKGKVISGKFTAAYNNLGAYELRVHTYHRINFDTIHFRMREEGSPVWQVQNTYVVDRFTDNLLYGFGFPVIADSQGKVFEFEFTSENGRPDNAIGFFAGYDSSATQYIFTRASITHNSNLLYYFIKEKLYSLVSDPYFLAYYLMFLAPFIFYISASAIRKSFIVYSVEFLLFFYMVAIYIFLPVAMAQDTIVYIFTLGIVMVAINLLSIIQIRISIPARVSAQNVFFAAIILAILLVGTIVFKNDLEANRIAVSLFYTIAFALILAVKELRDSP